MMSSRIDLVPPTVSRRRLSAATFALAFLAGCSTAPVHRPDETTVKQFAGTGYQADEHFGVATTYANWVAGQLDLDISLTVPARLGPFPMVVYLPALGETRSAGEAWRTFWAQSGYAVLSLQPLAGDARVWATPQARSGDSAFLARERYSAKVTTERLAALQEALAELQRRHARGEAPLDKIDLSRVAIAGYDVGAYTAMLVAGESPRGVPVASLPFAVKAVIALSPYADFSGTPFDQRYAGISGPVLSVTSDNDADRLGVIPSPAIRKAPFDSMPSGNKYLLNMVDIPHAGLSGSAAGRLQDEFRDAGEKHQRAESETERSRDGGSRSSHRRSGTGGSSTDGGRRAPERGARSGDAASSQTTLAIAEAAIQSVTTAFLDAYLKGDAVAHEWLDKDATRWLRDRGEIKRK